MGYSEDIEYLEKEYQKENGKAFLMSTGYCQNKYCKAALSGRQRLYCSVSCNKKAFDQRKNE